MSHRVWTYWEGPRPPYVDLCLRSMAKVCGDGFRILTPENLGDYLPEKAIHPDYRNLAQPALRADCIRAALLAVHGGWWWDADTVGLASPESLMSRHQGASALYMAWDKLPTRVLNGYIYFAPGNSVALSWLEQINRILADRPESADWCSLGERLLTNLVPGLPGAVRLERRLFLPLDIDSSVHEFFEPGDPEEWIREDTICFGLNHSWFVYHFPQEAYSGLKEWRQSPSLAHRLFVRTWERLNG